MKESNIANVTFDEVFLRYQLHQVSVGTRWHDMADSPRRLYRI